MEIIKENEKARLEVSAGALVYRRGKDGISLAMIKDPYGKWTFPKGARAPRGNVDRSRAS